MSKLADELAQIGLANTLSELDKKIKELEKRIAELERNPNYER